MLDDSKRWLRAICAIFMCDASSALQVSRQQEENVLFPHSFIQLTVSMYFFECRQFMHEFKRLHNENGVFVFFCVLYM